MEAESLTCLCASVQTARTGTSECRNECLADLMGKLTVLPRVVLFTDQLGKTREHHSLIIVERGAR